MSIFVARELKSGRYNHESHNSKKCVDIFIIAAFPIGMMSGCANYEVNTMRGSIPGHRIAGYTFQVILK